MTKSSNFVPDVVNEGVHDDEGEGDGEVEHEPKVDHLHVGRVG